MNTRLDHRMALVIGTAIIAVFALPDPAGAQEGEESPSRTVRVATKELEPFVIIDDSAPDGLRGFSIDIWNEIADRLGFQTEWVELATVGEIVESARAGETDAAIAGISMTPDREVVIDFTHPYFDSGLQIVTRSGQDASVFSIIGGVITSGTFLIPLAGLLAMIAVISHLVWWGERKHNPDFPRSYREGIGEALWWSSVSVVTGGEAVKDIRRPLSRLMALLWMVVGLFLIAFVTAQAASSLTVSRLEGGIEGLDDLAGESVVTVEGTVAEAFLRAQNIPTNLVADIDAALAAVDSGTFDAAVYDAPVLAYRAGTDYLGQLELAGPVFAPDPYSIALTQGSELREPINEVILELSRDGTLDLLHEKWFRSRR